MMNFNVPLLAISLIVVLQLSWNGVSSEIKCPINYPQGFFCESICQKWGVLSGNTIQCFISNNGEYIRFVARNPAFGVWRFYRIDLTSHREEICDKSVKGDEFFLNETETQCPHRVKLNPYTGYNVRSSKQRFEEYNSATRGQVETNIQMDAICELATIHLCREGRAISCEHENCCYENLSSQACNETNIRQFDTCYQVLYSVFTSIP